MSQQQQIFLTLIPILADNIPNQITCHSAASFRQPVFTSYYWYP